ncbi:MAG: ParB/RepB/Spo0J family partition protein [Selenomonadaceae bacterium]|nr:ParB/RepB/Spo0J family partition protein [Selenomonadaceae bacterium]
MVAKKGGLGRGIEALLPQSQSQYEQINSKDSVQEILTELIQPNRYQPRREFDEGALNELAESIKSYGILQPLIVRRIEDGKYELIAGERRLRASKIVGLEKVPVIIRDYTDAQMSEISIIENVQRENLNVIEEAQAYDRLIKEFGHTQEIVAAKIGRSRSHISNMLRLLKLSPTVRALIAKGLLTLGQARPLLAIENDVIQVQAAEMILSEGLSVRKVEAFVNELKNSGLLQTLTTNMNSAAETTEVDDTTTTHAEMVSNAPTVKDTEKIYNASSNSDSLNNNDNVVKSEGIRNNDVTLQHKEQKPNKPAVKKELETPPLYIREAEDKLSDILGAKVKITTNKKHSRIQIDFATEEDLSRIIEGFDKSLSSDEVTSKPGISTKEEKIAALRKFSTSQNFSI